MNSTYTGLIFGCYELVIVIFSPIFGKFVSPPCMRSIALIRYSDEASGTQTALRNGDARLRSHLSIIRVKTHFRSSPYDVMRRFLDQCPGGTIYIVMCFSVRSVEAIGAAAFTTASFTIMAYTFPANVATMYVSALHHSICTSLTKPKVGHSGTLLRNRHDDWSAVRRRAFLGK